MSTEGIIHHHILPVVIAPQVWEIAVRFPVEPERESMRLGELLMMTLRSYCAADSDCKQINYELYYVTPEPGQHKVELLKLQLTRTESFLSVHLNPVDIQ